MSDPAALAFALEQKLRGWHDAGLTHLPRAVFVAPPPLAVVTPAPPTTPVEAAPAVDVPTTVQSVSQTQPVINVAAAGDDIMAKSRPKPSGGSAALSVEERNQQLAKVAKKVSACVRCQELASTRTQTVFGVGNPQARVMFIGEAPGADEDAQGEPFVGRAGKLLTDIIHACGWTRQEIYICNILRCRPPGNRNPSPEEASNCREFLDAQIQIVNPEYIVCWGTIAAQNLLGREETIGQLRNQWFEYGNATVLCTYHPSYLLRNPAAKKPVWEDMKLLLNKMGLKPPPPKKPS
ncbi:MAG: uracil-DNA glycosylase family protein [Planctomycetaceae bacterium]